MSQHCLYSQCSRHAVPFIRPHHSSVSCQISLSVRICDAALASRNPEITKQSVTNIIRFNEVTNGALADSIVTCEIIKTEGD